MIAICIGRFGLSLLEAKRTTPADYLVYQKAHDIYTEEQMFFISMQSWQNQAVQKTKGEGRHQRSAYRSFADFYDHNKQFQDLFTDKEQENSKKKLTMADKNRILQQRRKEVHNNGEL